MRFLILSDIHGNWDALEAVLADANDDYGLILNCGDLVGYGPEPNRVVDWCRASHAETVRGNHDKAAVGLTDLDWFNPVARISAEWTSKALSQENRDYLARLPMGPLTLGVFDIFHGSPLDEDEYLVTPTDVDGIHPAYPLSFFGHTHLQGGFLLHREGVRALTAPSIFIDDTASYLINPGSVGQPRDHDPRAAYALYDSQTRMVEYRRVAYDIDATARKIVEAGLPEMLGLRLYRGT